ncbi:MAG: hypothetical protein WAU89_16830 [Candidatus Acidiferrales bacterium]
MEANPAILSRLEGEEGNRLNFFSLILLLFVVSASGTQAPLKASRMTETPERDVLARAQEPDRGLVEFDCSGCSAMTDLLFVAPTDACGNAGCDFYVFKKAQGRSYLYLTNLFLDCGGFQFLNTKHHGLNDILSYSHLSAAEGTLVREEFDGKNYQTRESKVIPGSDFSSRITTPEPCIYIYLSKDLKKIH